MDMITRTEYVRLHKEFSERITTRRPSPILPGEVGQYLVGDHIILESHGRRNRKGMLIELPIFYANLGVIKELRQ